MVKSETNNFMFKDFSLGFLSGISLSMLIVIYRTFA
jgi:hypothetical protein